MPPIAVAKSAAPPVPPQSAPSPPSVPATAPPAVDQTVADISPIAVAKAPAPPVTPPPSAPSPPSVPATAPPAVDQTVADIPPIAVAKAPAPPSPSDQSPSTVAGTIELSGPIPAKPPTPGEKPAGVGGKTEPANEATVAGTVELSAPVSGNRPAASAGNAPISATRTVDIPLSPSGPSGVGATVQVSGSGTAGSGVVGKGLVASRRRSGRIGDSGSFAEKMTSGESLDQMLVIQPRKLTSDMMPGRILGRGDYNLTRKLGEGGMGVVYAAVQSSIRRSVALKMLKGGGGSREAAQREKFLAEAVVTGDLEHPNIVPIYDLGRDENGAVFYAMKHVKGTPWDKLLPKKSVVENVEILLKVADGVAFAHSRGVVHRDLKPENVMIGEFGEVLVMDWGLAISLDTHLGEVAMGGTPAYMAPEMTVGPMEQIDETSDVYLLGAILYEIVAGHRPHTGATVMECLMASANNVIVPTDKTGELIDIALKAMATEQADRFHSVPDFQQAIRDHQSHSESVALATRAGEDLAAARESGKYDWFSRALFAYQEAVALWEGNQRAKAGVHEAIDGYASAALRAGDYDLGLSLLEGQAGQHEELRNALVQARDERDSRQRRLQTARRIGVAMAASILLIVTVAFFWIRAEAKRAQVAEADAVQQRNKALDEKKKADDAREAEKTAKLVAEKARDEEKRQRENAVALQIREKDAREAADKARMAAENARLEALAAKEQKEAERQKAELARVAAEDAKKQAETERQKSQVAERTAVAARAEEERQRRVAERAKEEQEYAAYVARLGLASAKIDENSFDLALTLLEECPPRLRNWEWGRLRYLCVRDERTLKAAAPLETLDVSRDGQRIAVGGWGGEILVFELNATTPPVRIATGAAEVFAVAFSPDGSRLAIGSSSKPHFVSLWDARDGRRLGGLEGHTDSVLSARFSRDGERLLTGSYDNTARLWNLRDGTSKAFRGHDWWVWSAEFSGDEKRVVTASQDGTAMVWDVATGAASPPYLGHNGPVLAATFSPDGTLIASASQDQRILLWDPRTLREVDLAAALSSVGAAAPGAPTPSATGPGATLPGAAGTGTASSPTIAALQEHAAAVRSVQFSADGRLLASAGYDNVVALWDVGQRRLLKKFRGHAGRVTAARFAPGDQRIVSASLDRHIKVWGIAQYEEMKVLGGRSLRGHQESILGAAFSPDGKQVVTASRDRTAIAWDADSGKQLRTFDEGHKFLASAAWAFPDGKRVLTAAVDDSARVWDIATGAEQATLNGTGPHAAVALAPSGQFIVSGSNERSLRVWNPDGKLTREFRGFPSDFTAVAVSPDGTRVLAGDGTGRVRLVAVADGQTLWESRSHSRSITAIEFLGNGERAASASIDQTVALWDVAKGVEDASRVLKHPSAVTGLAVSRDGQWALTACADRAVRVWELRTGKEQRKLVTGGPAVTGVALSADGRRALTVTGDNKIRLWRTDDGRELSKNGAAGPLLDLAATSLLAWSATFAADGERILSVGGAEAHLWNAADGKLLVTFAPQSAVSSVQYSPDGKTLVTGGWDSAARLWNAATGATLRKLEGAHNRFVNASAFSPDGQRVATASDDGTARLWNVSTGAVMLAFRGHTAAVADIAYSPDGKRVVTASADKTARVWDTLSGETVFVLAGHTQAVLRAAYSDDGRWLMTGSEDGAARLWDAATGKPVGEPLAGHTSAVTAVAFSRDGTRVFTGSKDRTVKVWDPKTGKEVLSLNGHAQEVTVVAMSPDNRRLLTAARDGSAILWHSESWKSPPEANQPQKSLAGR